MITVANVNALTPLWQTISRGTYGTQMANGSLFSIDVAATPKRLLAFAADGATGCSGTPRTCSPRWTAPLSMTLFGVEALHGGYAVEGDRVYVVGWTAGFSGRWRLEVFDAHGEAGCSGVPKTCAPLWTASWGTASTQGGATLAISGNRVYVSTPSTPDAITVFDAAGVTGCTSGTTTTCSPIFSTTAPSGGGPIAVAGNRLVERENFGVQVFDAAGIVGCANQICAPQRVIQGPGFPSISGTTIYGAGGAFDLNTPGGCPFLGCDLTWNTTLAATPLSVPPTVAAGRVYIPETVVVTPTADVEVFDAAGNQSCSGDPRVCTPLFRFVTNSSVQGIAATASLAFISTARTQISDASLMAFDLFGVQGCAGTPGACDPLWRMPLSSELGFPSPPTVTNGLVAVSGDEGGIQVFAIPQ